MRRRVVCGVGIAAAIAITAACSDSSAPAEGVPVDAGADARESSRADGGRVGDPSSIPDASNDGAPEHPCTGKIVINEVAPSADAGAELVELFNPTDCAVDLSSWTLKTPATTLYTFLEGADIHAREFYLLGNDQLDVEVDDFFPGGLKRTGGQIGLLDDLGNVVDAVGYGTVDGGLYVEKAPAKLGGSASVGRATDGVDSDDNSADFHGFDSPTAGLPNE